jgi:glycosyltransferase involved in cell wall biosynthesis
MPTRLVHIAEVDLSPATGMGRVGWHWRESAQARGIPFVHIGPGDVPAYAHPREFPAAALRAWDQMRQPGDRLLVHEPASGAFIPQQRRAGARVYVVSHGLERRGWQMRCAGEWGPADIPTLRTRLLFPLWRLRGADRGVRHAHHVLVLNQQDAAFANTYYGRRPDDVTVLRHGVEPTTVTEDEGPSGPLTVLFLGSWLPRKGIGTLIDAATRLATRGTQVRWVLAGTGATAADILPQFPEPLRGNIEVIPTFGSAREESLFRDAHVFVLPSYFEGQPLALLQAMATGRCCVTTDCCGQRDLITHGANGLLFAPGDAAALTDHLARCADAPAFRHQLGAAARTSVATRTWTAAFDQVWELVSR